MPTVVCTPASEGNIDAAAEALRRGDLAIVPSDTVYGIAADIRIDAAVQAVYEAKGKRHTAPLQLLFAGPALVDRYAILTPQARALVEAIGPGGWTIIVPAAPGWTSPALAGGSTVGFRMPDCQPLRAVIEALGGPLAASSANRHGGPSPATCAAAVAQVGEHVSIALDAGPAAAGLDSTVVDCAGTDVVILREGAIDRHTVARILGLDAVTVVRSVRPDHDGRERQ